MSPAVLTTHKLKQTRHTTHHPTFIQPPIRSLVHYFFVCGLISLLKGCIEKASIAYTAASWRRAETRDTREGFPKPRSPTTMPNKQRVFLFLLVLFGGFAKSTSFLVNSIAPFRGSQIVVPTGNRPRFGGCRMVCLAAAVPTSDDDEAKNNLPPQKANNNNKKLPPTPCQRICRYNANFYDGQICIGCYREGYEIGHWVSMSPQEKSWALYDAAERVPTHHDEHDDDEHEGNVNKHVFGGAISRNELERQAQAWEESLSQ